MHAWKKERKKKACHFCLYIIEIVEWILKYACSQTLQMDNPISANTHRQKKVDSNTNWTQRFSKPTKNENLTTTS